jgi:hypothetical protein
MSAVHSEIRLPAYGRALRDLRRAGLVPDREVVVSFSWSWGVGWPRMVLPSDLEPECADFSPVAGLGCFLAWSPMTASVDRRDRTIKEIVRCRPTQLWVCDMTMPSESFFVITRKGGLELKEYQ